MVKRAAPDTAVQQLASEKLLLAISNADVEQLIQALPFTWAIANTHGWEATIEKYRKALFCTVLEEFGRSDILWREWTYDVMGWDLALDSRFSFLNFVILPFFSLHAKRR